MILDFIKEKKHAMTWSQQTRVTETMLAGKYSVKDEVLWELGFGAAEAWIKVNMLEMTDLYELDITVFGSYDSVEFQTSLDNSNWYTVPRNSNNKWSGYENIQFIFARMLFTNCGPDFKLTSWQIFGDERIEVNTELLSLTAGKLYPQSFFENYPLLPDFTIKYLMMLERNESAITKFFDDISVEVYLIFNEGDDGDGSIDTFPINSTPLNSRAGTTFVGASSAVINRVRGGLNFYDINGNCQVLLDFRSVVYGMKTDDPGVIYTWFFDDPYANPITNPSSKSVIVWGQESHLYTKLGNYYVRFIVRKNGQSYEGTQHVEIAPAPYEIIGPIYPRDGDKFEVVGLLKPYDQPTITGGAILIDNGDRTFTWHNNNEINADFGEIAIWDPYYEESVSLVFYYKEPLYDELGGLILDSTGNAIYVN